MKRFLPAIAITASLLGVQAAHAAPAAILTRVSGDVEVVRGAQKLKGRNGLALQNGDRVVIKKGTATVFSISRAPQTLKNGSLVIGAAASVTKQSPLWKGVVNGLSRSLDPGDRRVAATMRPGEIVPLAPVQSLIETARPEFEWRPGSLEAKRYELVILDAKKSVLWRGETATNKLTYPASAPPLQGSLSWQVSPMREEAGTWKPIAGWSSRATPFQIATPAQLRRVRADLAAIDAQLAGATPAVRALSRAALWNGSGFKAAALRELEGAGDDALVTSLRETLWIETGQQWRLAPTAKATKEPIGGADSAILAFTPTAPLTLAERKTYVAPDGAFSLQIPQRFCVTTVPFPQQVTLYDFGATPQGGARLGLALAPTSKFSAPGAILEFCKEILSKAPGGTKFRTEAPQDITFRGHRAKLWRWSDAANGAVSRGGWVEWIEKGNLVAVSWGASQPANPELLRPLLDTLSFENTPATPVPENALQELLTTMQNSVALMGQSRERQEKRSFEPPQTRAAPSVSEFEALDQKRLTLPANSHERAAVALEASRLVARLGWAASERGETATATTYFDRRAQLDEESYLAEAAANEADLRQTDAEIARWGKLTLPQNQSQSYAIALDGLMILKSIQLNAWRDMAMVRRDTPTLAKISLQLFNLRRAELEATQLSNEEPKKLWERQVAVAVALENLGDVAQERADLYGGRAYFTRSLEWRRAVPDDYSRRDVYESLRNRAVLENQIGELRLARDLYEQTLADLERVAPRREKEIAAETSEEVREYRRVEWLQTWSVMLNNLGVTTQNLGDYTAAENHLQRALKTIEALPETGFSGSVRAISRASTLSNLAVLRADTGDLESGAKLLGQSADIYRSIGNDSGLALALYNSAGLDYERKAYDAAASKTTAARALFAQLRQQRNVASADVFASKLAHEMGDHKRAVQLAESALELARTLGDADELSSAARNLVNQRLNALGKAPLTAPMKAELEAILQEAHAASVRSGSVNAAIYTLTVRATLQQKSGDLEGALATQQAALARLERLRATTSSGDAFSELESVYPLYDTAVSLLLKLNRPEEAFDMLSRARSKKLRDSLRLSALKSNDPVLQKLLDRATALDEKLAKTRAQLASESALPAPQRSEVRLKNLSDIVASTQQEFFDVSAQIKARNPRFEKALALSPRELKKAQRAIPAGALLLQYAALDDGLYIFAITRDSLQIIAPKVSKEELYQAVRAYRKAIDTDIKHLEKSEPIASIDAHSPLRSASESLSNWLLVPVQTQIDAAKTVAIVPSGELFYLPFHALGYATKEGPWRFLIEDKPVAYLAAGDVLAVAQERNLEDQGKGVLALGDPTGADLPAARTEVESIARLFPDSRALTGASASKAELLLPSSRDKRVLHLAAHGVLDASRPDQSFIQLAPSGKDDGKLRVGEIYGLDLNRVDLVTLSACRTALGDGEPDGTEISSLAESFSSAGTPSVVASLWNVEDQSTARLMETFYGALADGTSKGVALQKAQIALLRNPKTRHPVFWAPFELLGDWR